MATSSPSSAAPTLRCEQFIAGGVEDDETLDAAARREAREEASITDGLAWLRLDSVADVPRSAFVATDHWPAELRVVPEHCFAVDVSGHGLQLSREHVAMEWSSYDEARRRLTWPSNRAALAELWERLRSTR